MYIRRLEPSDKVAHFKCEDNDLNLYLRKYALANQLQNLGITYVALASEDTDEVVGYYTVAATSFPKIELPDSEKANLPYELVPAILLGRLARDKSVKGMGVGEALLQHCFQIALQVSSLNGTRFLIVDAYNNAVEWYKKFGLIPIEGGTHPRYTKMFLHIETIKKAFTNGCDA